MVSQATNASCLFTTWKACLFTDSSQVLTSVCSSLKHPVLLSTQPSGQIKGGRVVGGSVGTAVVGVVAGASVGSSIPVSLRIQSK